MLFFNRVRYIDPSVPGVGEGFQRISKKKKTLEDFHTKSLELGKVAWLDEIETNQNLDSKTDFKEVCLTY